MDDLNLLKNLIEKRKQRVNDIASVISLTQSATASKKEILPDGSKKEILVSKNNSGQNVYSVSKDGKNVVHFTSERQADDYFNK